jgi:hypothetical protein
MGKTIQAVCVILTHPREGDILGPDITNTPAHTDSPPPLPKMRLKLRLPIANTLDSSTAPPPLPNSTTTAVAGTTTTTTTPPEPPTAADPAITPILEELEDAVVPLEAAVGGKKGKAAKVKKPRVDPMRAAFEQAKDCKADIGDEGAKYCGATLVVCPVVAAMQWRQEIARYTANGMVRT